MKNRLLNKSGLWKYFFDSQKMEWSLDQEVLFDRTVPENFKEFLELVHP